MIVYDNFWRTLKASRESTYTLIKKHNISSSTIDKLRKKQTCYNHHNKRFVPNFKLRCRRYNGIYPQ